MTIIQEKVKSLSPVKGSGTSTYEVTILAEGKGSSGTYTREAIHSGLDTFKAGTPSFFAHTDPSNIPNRNVRTDLAGKLSESWIDVTDTERHSLRGKFQPSPENADFFEFFHEQIALSISASGTAKQGESGEIFIESFDHTDPLTSVDVVFKGGIDIAGFDRQLESSKFEESKKIRISESARKIFAETEVVPTVISAVETQDKKGNDLELKDLAEKLDTLTQAVEQLVADKNEKVQAEVNAEALAEQISQGVKAVAENLKKIDEADIPSEEVKSELREQASRGEDVTKAIESAVKLTAALRESDKDKFSGQFSEGESKTRELRNVSFLKGDDK